MKNQEELNGKLYDLYKNEYFRKTTDEKIEKILTEYVRNELSKYDIAILNKYYGLDENDSNIESLVLKLMVSYNNLIEEERQVLIEEKQEEYNNKINDIAEKKFSFDRTIKKSLIYTGIIFTISMFLSPSVGGFSIFWFGPIYVLVKFGLGPLGAIIAMCIIVGFGDNVAIFYLIVSWIVCIYEIVKDNSNTKRIEEIEKGMDSEINEVLVKYEEGIRSNENINDEIVIIDGENEKFTVVFKNNKQAKIEIPKNYTWIDIKAKCSKDFQNEDFSFLLRERDGVIIHEGEEIFSKYKSNELIQRVNGKRVLITIVVMVIALAIGYFVILIQRKSNLINGTINGWTKTFTGKWKYCDEKEGDIKGRWFEINNEVYYFDDDGIMKQNAWIDYMGDRFYVNNDGIILRNQWIGDYYVGVDGKMLKNTTTPNGIKVGPTGKRIND